MIVVLKSRLDELARTLAAEMSAHKETQQTLALTEAALEAERTRRVSAEAMAVERRAEADRLVAENTRLHEDMRSVVAERMKSLDALNVKLMTPREDPPPDMSKFKLDPLREVKSQLIRQARDQAHRVDEAVLMKLHPKFANLRPRHETAEEAPAEQANG